MLPFKVVSAVLCDDIRIEKNDKFLLIGVYAGTVIVPGIPADLNVCWWIQIVPEEVGKIETDIQVIKDDGSILLRARAAFEVHQKEWSALPIPKTPLRLQSEGNFKLQMKLKTDTDWTTIYEFDVRVGSVAGAVLQQTVQQMVS
jgi:hypothetical protein